MRHYYTRDQILTFNQQAIFTQIHQNANDANACTIVLLHGWMDNLASFNDLIEALFKHAQMPLKLIAIDLPGHGKSDHAIGLHAYNIWGDIACIMAVVEQLELESFSLIGHSRGAMIATLLAGTVPERITHLITIESIIPPIEPAISAPDTLRESVQGQLDLLAKKQNYYDNFEKAVRARENGIVGVTYLDALTLAKHGVVQNDKGFYWRIDPMLKAPSEMKLSLGQIDAFFNAIKAKVFLILAQDGLILRSNKMMAWINAQPLLKPFILNGGHHLHMSQANNDIAKYIVSKIEK